MLGYALTLPVEDIVKTVDNRIRKTHGEVAKLAPDAAPAELCPILGDGVIRRRREFWFRRPAYRL